MNLSASFYIIFFTLFMACNKPMVNMEEPDIPEETFIVESVDLTQICQLNETANEISGLLFLDGEFIYHNDGGDHPYLYKLSQACNTSDTVRLNNASNKDWEAISWDSEMIYIGDFGNNNGTRKDLGVYLVSREDIFSKVSVTANFLNFTYEDQFDFESSDTHNFDCEAMITRDEYIYLFTKNRGNQGTNVYRINKEDDHQIAQKIDSTSFSNLITDAIYDEASDRLFLLAYRFKNGIFESELMVITTFSEKGFRDSKTYLLKLWPDLQLEAMTLDDKGNLWLANEANPLHNGVLYMLDVNGYN